MKTAIDPARSNLLTGCLCSSFKVSRIPAISMLESHTAWAEYNGWLVIDLIVCLFRHDTAH